jgi:hypothetical protein
VSNKLYLMHLGEGLEPLHPGEDIFHLGRTERTPEVRQREIARQFGIRPADLPIVATRAFEGTPEELYAWDTIVTSHLAPYRYRHPETGMTLGNEWYQPPAVVLEALLAFLRGGYWA